MESDNTVALGLAETTRDRMYKASDAFTFYFCKKCHNKAEANRITKFQYCRYCDSKEFVREVDMCFTTGLMMEEMNAMGIKMELELEDDDQ